MRPPFGQDGSACGRSRRFPSVHGQATATAIPRAAPCCAHAECAARSSALARRWPDAPPLAPSLSGLAAPPLSLGALLGCPSSQNQHPQLPHFPSSRGPARCFNMEVIRALLVCLRSPLRKADSLPVLAHHPLPASHPSAVQIDCRRSLGSHSLPLPPLLQLPSVGQRIAPQRRASSSSLTGGSGCLTVALRTPAATPGRARAAVADTRTDRPAVKHA